MEIRNLKALILVLWVVGCSRSPVEVAPFTALTQSNFNHLLVLTSNYKDDKGELVSVALTESAPEKQITKGALPLTSDAWFRVFPENPNVYVINRYLSNVQIFDKSTLEPASVQESLSAQAEFGLPPNPQDVLVDAVGQVFVSGLNLDNLLVLSPSLEVVSDKIDLASFADPLDKLPECSHLEWVDGKLWVALERLNRGADRKSFNWLPTDHSSVVVLDPPTKKTTEIVLKGINPVSPFRVVGPSVYLANRGGNAANTGGSIEKIDRQTLQTTLLMTEVELGQKKPVDLEVEGDLAWVILEKPDFGTQLVEVNLRTKTVTQMILDTDSVGFLKGLAYDRVRKFLFVGNRAVNDPGIMIWNTVTKKFEFSTPIRVGFPPEGFELLE